MKLPRLALPAILASALFVAAARPFVSKCGLWWDEASQGQVAVELLRGLRSSEMHLAWGMKDTYQGALKAYIVSAPFAVLGPSAAVLRGTTIALGAVAVGAAALLAALVYGPAAALYLGLLMASDLALIGGAAFDQACANTSIALKMAALLLLALWRRRGGAGWAFAGGLFLGLAVWDKSTFLWVLAALPAASWVFYRDRLRPGDARGLIVCAAGVLLGAAPFLVFNAAHPLITFRDPGHMGWGLRTHLAELPGWVAARWSYLRAGLSGQGIYAMVTGALPPPGIGRASLLLAHLGAALLAACALRREKDALRDCAFWLGLTGLIFAAAALSPVPVKYHHFYTCFPFPQLAFVALLAGVLRRFEGRAATAALAALLALPLVHNALALRAFAAELDRTGGSRQFYEGIEDVARFVDEEAGRRPGLTVFDDALLAASLRVMRPHWPAFERAGAEPSLRASCGRAGVERPVLVLKRSQAELGWGPADRDERRGPEKPAAVFLYRDGGTWVRVYRRWKCREART